MSERDILLEWLGRAARRARLNLWLREAGSAACGILALIALYLVLRLGIGVPEVVAAVLPLLVFAGAGTLALFAYRLSRRPTLAQAAAAADARADLKDELGSALWFVQQGGGGPLSELLLVRASRTVRGLDPSRLFPLDVPRSLPVAVALASLTGVLVWFSPRTSFPVSSSVAPSTSSAFASNAYHGSALQPPAGANRHDASAGAEPARATWSQLEALARELTGAQDEAVAQAIRARDARSAARLVEELQHREATRAPSGASARPETEQMSAALAEGILERLKELMNEEAPSPTHPAAGQNGAAQPTAQLKRELREEMEGVQQGRPGERSAGEDALNTLLRAISRNSSGGRELVRGQTEPMQEAGRTSVGAGAMGRRVGVSQTGGGDGEQPPSSAARDSESQPVLGPKSVRLQAQLQMVKVPQGDSDERQGTEESFYAATQAQASKIGYETVMPARSQGAEQVVSSERMPLVYRDAVKRYTLAQHRKEKSTEQER
jgi:hypothetical protein